MRRIYLLLIVGWMVIEGTSLFGQEAAKPLGGPRLDPPTLHCLGVYWLIGGDENRNAGIDCKYRPAGTEAWQTGPPLFRVERGAHQTPDYPSRLEVPDGAWLFAGSVVDLEPDTQYELKLTLGDPDGRSVPQTLEARTAAEPVAPAKMTTYYVVPDTGGDRRGSGTAEDPFRGLEAAQAAAAPGTLFLLRGGVYKGTFQVTKDGEPGKPIIWRGAAGERAVIDAQGDDAERPGRAISASDRHDVWFEQLEVRNAEFNIVAHDASRIVIRRCYLHGCDYGITWSRNSKNVSTGFFVADNLIVGPSTWPRTQGIENARGVQASGTGHVICYNRIRCFADAIDTMPSPEVAAIDIHNNDISEMTDDGIETDYSQRNVRCFRNRLTNVYQGISTQPVFGGPVYIFRNVMYNVVAEPLKMHNSPSGAIVVHNTSVKQGMPLVLTTGDSVRNCVYRNNLFIGTGDRYAYETTAPMVDCDFDYDGFGGGPWGNFLKWNGQRYATLGDVRRSAPVYRHAVFVTPATVFASGLMVPVDLARMYDPRKIDVRLNPASEAVDAGAVVPGLDGPVRGKAPDLGAFELGEEPPHYGPRPVR